jgi:hypothetical protein
MKRVIGLAAACVVISCAMISMADEAWPVWRHTVSGSGIFAASDTFMGGSSAFGMVLEYELTLPQQFAAFVNYREMEYESDGWDYTMQTRLKTEGDLSGLSFGGRYYPINTPRFQVYGEGGYGSWSMDEDDYRNGAFDRHNEYDANVILLGVGIRAPLFDLPLDLMANVVVGYLWWDEEWGTDDDLYLAAGLGLGLRF